MTATLGVREFAVGVAIAAAGALGHSTLTIHSVGVAFEEHQKTPNAHQSQDRIEQRLEDQQRQLDAVDDKLDSIDTDLQTILRAIGRLEGSTQPAGD